MDEKLRSVWDDLTGEKIEHVDLRPIWNFLVKGYTTKEQKVKKPGFRLTIGPFDALEGIRKVFAKIEETEHQQLFKDIAVETIATASDSYDNEYDWDAMDRNLEKICNVFNRRHLGTNYVPLEEWVGGDIRTTMREILDGETLLKIEEFEVYNVTVENNKMTFSVAFGLTNEYDEVDAATLQEALLRMQLKTPTTDLLEKQFAAAKLNITTGFTDRSL